MPIQKKNLTQAIFLVLLFFVAFLAPFARAQQASDQKQQLHANQNNIDKYDANGSVTNASSSSPNLQNQFKILQPIQPQKINILNPGVFLTH
jgi:outer membrane lipoprotein-sorting protein